MLNEKPEEIEFPKWKEVNIFADTETFISLDESLITDEFWRNSEYKCRVLREFGKVRPWLLCWSAPRFYEYNGKIKFRDYNVKHESILDSRYHENFFIYLSWLYKAKRLPIVYFHNTTYDLTSIILPCWIKLDPDLKVYVMVKEKQDSFIYGGMESVKYGFKCKFGDTNKYESISVSKLGETMGFSKGVVPYEIMNLELDDGLMIYTNIQSGEREKFSLSSYLDYCHRDVFIIENYFKNLEYFNNKLNNVIIGKRLMKNEMNTLGKHSKNLLSRYLYRETKQKFDDFFRLEISKTEYTIQRNSNLGGYVSYNLKKPNYIKKTDEKIYLVDINSSYPSIMNCGVPFGTLLEEIDIEVDRCNYITWKKILVTSFEWNENLNFLSAWGIRADRTYDGVGSSDLYHLYIPEEVFDWLNLNSRIEYELIGTFYQRKTYELGNYVNAMLCMRNKLKDKRDSFNNDQSEYHEYDVLQNKLKINMNSIYGQMCKKEYTTEKFYNGERFLIFDKEGAKYPTMLTAAYITWMARLKLFKKIKELVEFGASFLYCDTDSILFSFKASMDDEVRNIIGIDTGKFGQWKVEGSFDEFHYMSYKKYIMINKEKPEKTKIAFAGILNLEEWKKAIIRFLKTNLDESLPFLREVFNKDNNWIFKNSKRVKIRNKEANALIFNVVDFNTVAMSKKNTKGRVWLDEFKNVRFERV